MFHLALVLHRSVCPCGMNLFESVLAVEWQKSWNTMLFCDVNEVIYSKGNWSFAYFHLWTSRAAFIGRQSKVFDIQNHSTCFISACNLALQRKHTSRTHTPSLPHYGLPINYKRSRNQWKKNKEIFSAYYLHRNLDHSESSKKSSDLPQLDNLIAEIFQTSIYI